jgi:hypothetical protein
MIKKRAMAEARWISDMAMQWIDEINVKHLKTGYADDQPSHPYWVRPCNYSQVEWLNIRNWMLETFGDCNWSIPNGRWVGSNRKYWFRHEQDRTFFILRWS